MKLSAASRRKRRALETAARELRAAQGSDRDEILAARRALRQAEKMLTGTGVYAAHVPIFAWIGSGGPETQADTIAQTYWDIYTKRDGAEHPYRAQ